MDSKRKCAIYGYPNPDRGEKSRKTQKIKKTAFFGQLPVFTTLYLRYVSRNWPENASTSGKMGAFSKKLQLNGNSPTSCSGKLAGWKAVRLDQNGGCSHFQHNYSI